MDNSRDLIKYENFINSFYNMDKTGIQITQITIKQATQAE